jgi:transglutaminase-like putative cysteine protease
MRRRHILLLLAFLLALAAYSTWPVHGNFASAQTTPSRTIAFTYQVHVPATKDANGNFLLWLPLPQQDEYQSVRNLQIESAVAHAEGRETENGNSYVLFRPTPAQVQAGFDATIHFVATRFEHKVSLDTATAKIISANASVPKDLQRDLEPDNLVPLNGVIGDLAKEQTAGDTTALAKARHIYDYVVATMRYDKSGDGWGRGDAVWACTSKRGNCTDFHSLLIGMMRASGIPARFEIGFPIRSPKVRARFPAIIAGPSSIFTVPAGFPWTPPKHGKIPPSVIISSARMT